MTATQQLLRASLLCCYQRMSTDARKESKSQQTTSARDDDNVDVIAQLQRSIERAWNRTDGDMISEMVFASYESTQF
jgi:hypothetical protein